MFGKFQHALIRSDETCRQSPLRRAARATPSGVNGRISRRIEPHDLIPSSPERGDRIADIWLCRTRCIGNNHPDHSEPRRRKSRPRKSSPQQQEREHAQRKQQEIRRADRP